MEQTNKLQEKEVKISQYTYRKSYSVINHQEQVLYTTDYNKALNKLLECDKGYIKVITTEYIVKEINY